MSYILKSKWEIKEQSLNIENTSKPTQLNINLVTQTYKGIFQDILENCICILENTINVKDNFKEI